MIIRSVLLSAAAMAVAPYNIANAEITDIPVIKTFVYQENEPVWFSDNTEVESVCTMSIILDTTYDIWLQVAAMSDGEESYLGVGLYDSTAGYGISETVDISMVIDYDVYKSEWADLSKVSVFDQGYRWMVEDFGILDSLYESNYLDIHINGFVSDNGNIEEVDVVDYETIKYDNIPLGGFQVAINDFAACVSRF